MRSLSLSAAVASLASFAAAAKDSRTFAVLHFHGDGPLTTGRSDPIVSPGEVASHVHTVQGGNAFGNAATGASMLESTCSTADIAGDKSAYWMPSLYFHDVQNGTFEPVPLFYMNVYYFFEATNDDIKAFPVGLQMVSGDASKATPPATGGDVLDPAAGPVQPAQFTCPRKSFDPPSYPAGSDGTAAGLADPNNKGAGAGFPFAECDGYASPLRADLHFPSCYDPSKALTDFRHNTAFPSDAGDGKQDCPAGWVHVPHLFYEMYWNTPLFADRWTPNEGRQPFVLSNGDAAGYSLHGDFLAAWDTDVLQTIIDTCDAGDRGMDKCPNVETVLEGQCSIANPSPETIDGVLTALPGNNPLFGWEYGAGGYGTGSTGGTTGTGATSTGGTSTGATTTKPTTTTTTTPTTTTKPTTTKPTKPTTTKATTKPAKPTTTTTPTTTTPTTPTSTSTSTTTTDMTTTTTAIRKPTSPPATTLVRSTRTAAMSYGHGGYGAQSSIPVVVGAAVSSSSLSSLSSSSSSTSTSTSTSSTTSPPHGCKPHAPMSDVTTTETITLYTTSTSTVFTATPTRHAKHRHHQAHRGRW